MPKERTRVNAMQLLDSCCLVDRGWPLKGDRLHCVTDSHAINSCGSDILTKSHKGTVCTDVQTVSDYSSSVGPFSSH